MISAPAKDNPESVVEDVLIHGLAHDGRAVGRLRDGRALFVAGALPGQRVRVAVTSLKKRMAEARLLTVLEAAPTERPLPCVHGSECGGCPWQALPYPEQTAWKERLLHDALIRIGHLRLEHVARPLVCAHENGAPREWGYRNKMEFSFGPVARHGEGRTGSAGVGLYRRASRDLVEVSSCLLQSGRAMRVLAHIRLWLRVSDLAWAQEAGTKRAPALRFLVIRECGRECGRESGREYGRESGRACGREDGTGQASAGELAPGAPACGDGGSCLVEVISGPLPPGASPKRLDELDHALLALGESLLRADLGVSGFVHSERRARSDVAYGELCRQRLGDSMLVEELRLSPQAAPTRLRLSHDAFFQINTPAAELLYQGAAALAGELLPHAPDRTHCWDLYCGAGGLSLALAPLFQRVTGVDAMPGAVDLARQNSREAGNCRFLKGDLSAAATLEALLAAERPALLCADPPRGGLDPASLAAVLRSEAPALMLVSCNTASLARDLAALAGRYAVHSLQPFDLFPQTPHVETLVGLKRRA